MSFSKLRKSRLTMMVMATAWLPYMMVCCIVAPFESATGSTPKCHVLAAVMPATAQAAQAPSDDGHSQVAVDGAKAPHQDCQKGSSDGETTPGRACCELTGKANVTIAKSVDFGAQPIIVAVAFQVPEFQGPTHLAETVTHADVRQHAPPLYLSNASFLI